MPGGIRSAKPHLRAPPPSLAIRTTPVVEHSCLWEQPQPRAPAPIARVYRVQRHSTELSLYVPRTTGTHAGRTTRLATRHILAISLQCAGELHGRRDKSLDNQINRTTEHVHNGTDYLFWRQGIYRAACTLSQSPRTSFLARSSKASVGTGVSPRRVDGTTSGRAASSTMQSTPATSLATFMEQHNRSTGTSIHIDSQSERSQRERLHFLRSLISDKAPTGHRGLDCNRTPTYRATLRTRRSGIPSSSSRQRSILDQLQGIACLCQGCTSNRAISQPPPLLSRLGVVFFLLLVPAAAVLAT